MATVNKDFVVRNGVVAGAEVQGTQLVSTTSSLPPLTVTSSAQVDNLNVDLLDGNHGSYYLNFNNFTNTPSPVVEVELTGDVTGSASTSLTNLGNGFITINTTIEADSIVLGTDTVGNYVASLEAGTGVFLTASAGEGISPTVSIGQDVSPSASVTFGHVTFSETDGSPFTVSSSAQITNLNSTYLGGYTLEEVLSGGGVQSVVGTDNEIEVSASTGNVQVGLARDVSIVGSLTVGENFIVSGSTVVINSTTVTIEDPIFTLGGEGTGIDDGKDRGIEFKWNDGEDPKVGFFGFDNSTGKFTFIPDATNTSEVFAGNVGEIEALLDWDNLLNVVSPTVTLTGDVSGSGTLTNLGSASITVSVEKDFNLVFTGDVTGTGTVSDLNSASISLSITPDSVTLGTDTSGDYVANIFGTPNQVIVEGSGGETASVVLSLPQDISASSTPTFNGVRFDHGGVTTSTVTIVANDLPIEIDSFTVSTFTTAEYLVQAKQGTKMTSTKVLVMWDGTDAYISEYAIVDSSAGAANVELSVSESGGDLVLTAESPDAGTTSVVLKVIRTAVRA